MCLTYKTVARLLGSILRELSVGLREFLLKFNRESLRHAGNCKCKLGGFQRANTVRPYDDAFAFAIILRDAEDVIPYN